MSKEEGKYYVKLTFEYGKHTASGNEAKNTAEVLWRDMDYEEAVVLENMAVVPGLNDITTAAGKLGMIAAGVDEKPDKR